jgi:hypothetical protein
MSRRNLAPSRKKIFRKRLCQLKRSPKPLSTGDCNLDMVEAGARKGVEFVLTRGETAAAIMASVSAELAGG